MITPLWFCLPSDQLVLAFRSLFCIDIGDRVLTRVEMENERRIQETYEQMTAKERKRMENEYREKSNELIRAWKAKLEEEKLNLQKVHFSFL